MEASGYYDSAAWVAEGTVGAWTLVVGALEDGRYCVDHYSRADSRKQRLYYDTKQEALAYASTFAGRTVNLTTAP